VKTAADARCGAAGRSRRGSKGPKGADEATGDRVADSGRVGDARRLDVRSSDECSLTAVALVESLRHELSGHTSLSLGDVRSYFEQQGINDANAALADLVHRGLGGSLDRSC
jgi:hypothetical protein